jgi:uncharacterized protein (UPF0335 family)
MAAAYDRGVGQFEGDIEGASRPTWRTIILRQAQVERMSLSISPSPLVLSLSKDAFPSYRPCTPILTITGVTQMADATDDRLRLLIERVERLEEEKKGIADDIRDVYAEAKAVGYDAKIMRQIVRLRKMKPDDRAEMEAILDTYKAALGLG